MTHDASAATAAGRIYCNKRHWLAVIMAYAIKTAMTPAAARPTVVPCRHFDYGARTSVPTI